MPEPLWVGSPNFTPGRTAPIDTIVVHWMAGWLAGADQTFQDRVRQTSAHYGIEDGTVHQYVKEADTAWHAGSFPANSRSIGIEHS
ncbi:N-acetylmuramoyl-L-alanine amidase, partial [Escherichia coli]|uniref:N-acetylmuramoyl-L-alanine amidase n=1 Tax=Escherichia coli TaxID=562 RepID=UPI001E5065E9